MRRALLLLALLACERGLPANTGKTSGPPPAPARPASEVPQLKAAHLAEGDITIDGVGAEPAWQKCGTTGALGSPMTGAPEPGSKVQAEARVCWTDSRLLVRVTVKDAAPVSPFARDDVDPHLWERSSAVEVMLQPGDPNDNRNYFELQVDTHGAVWDTRFDDYNRPVEMGPTGKTYGHEDWNAHLERAVNVDPSHGEYTVEMALPWTSVTSDRTAVPPRPGDAWRMNFYSFRDGQRDSLAWSPLMGRGNFHFSGRFGRVVF